MTPRTITIQIPTGWCRRCREVVDLAAPKRPRLTPNGCIVVRGSCSRCGTVVAGFVEATLLEDILGEAGLTVVTVVVLAMGIRAGYATATARSKERRADDMLRVMRHQRLTLGELARRSRLLSAHALRLCSKSPICLVDQRCSSLVTPLTELIGPLHVDQHFPVTFLP